MLLADEQWALDRIIDPGAEGASRLECSMTTLVAFRVKKRLRAEVPTSSPLRRSTAESLLHDAGS